MPCHAMPAWHASAASMCVCVCVCVLWLRGLPPGTRERGGGHSRNDVRRGECCLSPPVCLLALPTCLPACYRSLRFFSLHTCNRSVCLSGCLYVCLSVCLDGWMRGFFLFGPADLTDLDCRIFSWLVMLSPGSSHSILVFRPLDGTPWRDHYIREFLKEGIMIGPSICIPRASAF